MDGEHTHTHTAHEITHHSREKGTLMHSLCKTDTALTESAEEGAPTSTEKINTLPRKFPNQNSIWEKWRNAFVFFLNVSKTNSEKKTKARSVPISFAGSNACPLWCPFCLRPLPDASLSFFMHKYEAIVLGPNAPSGCRFFTVSFFLFSCKSCRKYRNGKSKKQEKGAWPSSPLSDTAGSPNSLIFNVGSKLFFAFPSVKLKDKHNDGGKSHPIHSCFFNTFLADFLIHVFCFLCNTFRTLSFIPPFLVPFLFLFVRK